MALPQRETAERIEAIRRQIAVCSRDTDYLRTWAQLDQETRDAMDACSRLLDRAFSCVDAVPTVPSGETQFGD